MVDCLWISQHLTQGMSGAGLSDVGPGSTASGREYVAAVSSMERRLDMTQASRYGRPPWMLDPRCVPLGTYNVHTGQEHTWRWWITGSASGTEVRMVNG